MSVYTLCYLLHRPGGQRCLSGRQHPLSNFYPEVSGILNRPSHLHIETEIKFTLDADNARRIPSARLVRNHTERIKPGRRYLSTYYDTRQHLLRKSGVTLRVRQVDGRYEQTIKIPIEGSVGMLNFEEWTIPLPCELPNLSLFDPAVTARFNPRRREVNLMPVFTTDIDRTVIELGFRDSRIELALDQGRITGHGKSARAVDVRELELELLSGSPVDMLDFALALNDDFEIHPEHRTKAQRGYALVRRSLRPRAVKAKHVLLDARMSAGQAFHKIMADALQQLFLNERPTIEGMPPGIHQARVSIRRIRAALRAFKRVLPYDKRKAFNGEFRWFQHRLAPARDWHVFYSETLPRIQDNKPNARVIVERLKKLALTERRRATGDAVEVFKTRRYTRLLLQFQRWLLSLDPEAPPLDLPVTEFAVAVMKKSRRYLLTDLRPLSRMTEDEVHELRKRGKKARYATEFFCDLWTAEQVKDAVEPMEKLQDLLGEANDASVARQVLAAVPPRVLQSSAFALVHLWSDEQNRRCIKSGQAIWRQIHRTPPFWLENRDRFI